MKAENYIKLDFPSRSSNEVFARTAAAAFAAQLDPTLEELGDIKTAVSEAVTNAIVHGYAGGRGTVRLFAGYTGEGHFRVDVIDRGCGIADVQKARQPFFTTSKGDQERSGMGFTVMESFMDAVEVESEAGQGTTVRLTKRLHPRDEAVPRRA